MKLSHSNQQELEKALERDGCAAILGGTPPVTSKLPFPHEVLAMMEEDSVAGYVVKDSSLQQSDNWDAIFMRAIQHPGQRLEGFPFSVRFPQMYGGKRYAIITVNSEIEKARVDASREFMSEGLEWKTGHGNHEQSAIAAWRELPMDKSQIR